MSEKNRIEQEELYDILLNCSKKPFCKCGNDMPKLNLYNWKEIVCTCLIKVDTHYQINVTFNGDKIPKDYPVMQEIHNAMLTALGYVDIQTDLEGGQTLYSVMDGCVKFGIRPSADFPLQTKKGFSQLLVDLIEPRCFVTDKEYAARMIFDYFTAWLVYTLCAHLNECINKSK